MVWFPRKYINESQKKLKHLWSLPDNINKCVSISIKRFTLTYASWESDSDSVARVPQHIFDFSGSELNTIWSQYWYVCFQHLFHNNVHGF